MYALYNILPEDVVRIIREYKDQLFVTERQKLGWKRIHKELTRCAGFNIEFKEFWSAGWPAERGTHNLPASFIVLRSITKPWSLNHKIPYHFLIRDISEKGKCINAMFPRNTRNRYSYADFYGAHIIM